MALPAKWLIDSPTGSNYGTDDLYHNISENGYPVKAAGGKRTVRNGVCGNHTADGKRNMPGKRFCLQE